MPRKLGPQDTIATVWPYLTHQRDYVAGARHKAKLCHDKHGNAHVKIGITGSGQKPCYRVLYKNTDGTEGIFGSYWDMHDPLENENAINTNWAEAAMTYDEVHALMVERHSPKPPKVA